MNNTVKTASFLGGAVALVLIAGFTGQRAVSNELFQDEGEEFFASFTDPNAATELEVWEFNQDSGEFRGFDVKKDDKGIWTIPSHSNYPADAKTRMAKSAAMLVGLKKDRVVSDLKDDHGRFGVIDPKDETSETKGRGTRVTFKSGGAVLAELIVGKEVEGKMDMHYVRLPDKRRVYAAKFDNQLSTKFADWIETDLLKAQAWDISHVTFDNYSVDEQQGAIIKGDKIEVSKDDSSKWTVAGMADTEEPNEEKLREIGESLTQIKIVGVRHKPEGLTAALKQATGFDRMALQQMLQQKGYFLTREGGLVSNEGDLLFETKKGIRYTLRFGEIVYGEGEEITSGKESAKKLDAKADAPGPQPKAGNNRYLMVTAEFAEDLLPKPVGLRLADDVLDKRRQARQRIEAITGAVDAYKLKHDGKLPATLAQLLEKPNDTDPAPLDKLDKDPWDLDYAYAPTGDTFVVMSYGADKASGGEGADLDIRSDQFAKEDELKKVADEWKQYDQKVTDGRKEAASLTKRFGPWYYVISAELFTKLKPQRKDLVKAKSAETPAGGASPAGNGAGAIVPGK